MVDGSFMNGGSIIANIVLYWLSMSATDHFSTGFTPLPPDGPRPDWLKIRVSAEHTEWKGKPAIHICYLDNGTGYPPEMLEHCNHILEHPEDVKDGHHIGIYNIVKATSLIYQEKAVFLFSNELDAGARVDLYIQADKEETHESADC